MKENRLFTIRTKNLEKLNYTQEEIDTFSEQEKVALLKRNTDFFNFFKNPSIHLQKLAVSIGSTILSKLDNPSEEVQLAAVRENGLAIGRIQNPSEAVQLAAVQQDGSAIAFISNQSEEIQYAAIKSNFYAIRYMEFPSEKVCNYANKQYFGPYDIEDQLPVYSEKA